MAAEAADMTMRWLDDGDSDSETSQISEDPDWEKDFYDGVDPDLEIPRSLVPDDPDPDWEPGADDEEDGQEDDEEEGQEEEAEAEEQPPTSTQAKSKRGGSLRAREEEGCDGGRGVGRGRVNGKGRGRGRGRARGEGREVGRGRGGSQGRELSGAPWLGVDVDDIVPPQPVFRPARSPGPQLAGGLRYSALDLFHLYITKAMLLEIVRNSNSYGQSNHPEAWQEMTLADLYSYITMVVYMGLVDLKTLRDYWRRSDLYSLPFPPSVISGRKFQAISRSLYLSSPEADEANARRRGTAEYDRLCKVKPMYTQIRETCRAHFHPRQHVSIDERMVKSKARISLRQHMKDKPTKWGYKLFVLADSSAGYTWDFFIYEGKGAPVVRGLSYDSVMNLMDVAVLGRGYKLYVDNFYTSPALFLDLLQKHVWACGTIRAQRIGFPRDRPGGLDRRSPRGTIRWIREGPLLFVTWRDTRDVSLCSTIHQAHADDSVQRRVRADGRWAEQAIPAPPAVTDYNKHMGGVDLSDAMIKYYNILRKTRKWYRTLFYHFLDIGIVNAFILHQELARERQEAPLTQKEFREALVLELKAVGSASTAPPQAPPSAPPGAAHRPRHFTVDGSAGRRRCVHCSMKTTVQCSSCSVALCFTVSRDCYSEWHTEHHL